MKFSNQFRVVLLSIAYHYFIELARPKSNMYCFEPRPSERLSDNTIATINENQRNVILYCLIVLLLVFRVYFFRIFPSSR